MATFRFSSDYIDYELDGAQGWAYCNWARENQFAAMGASFERSSPGYIKQEWNKLMKQYDPKKYG